VSVPVRRAAVALIGLVACGWLAVPAPAQSTLERTPLLGGWADLPGHVNLVLPTRFQWEDGALGIIPNISLSYGIGTVTAAGLRYAPGAALAAGETDDADLYLRYHSFGMEHGLPLELMGEVAFNPFAGSVDTEIGASRWLGPVRLLGALRGMTSPYGESGTRYAAGAGAVFFPGPASLPVALAGDVATLFDRGGGERLAWSGGVQIGLPYAEYTLSLFATNTRSTTVQGRSLGDGTVRYGIEVTVPWAGAGRLFGVHAPRERGLEAVEEDVDRAASASVDIYRHAYGPARVIVPAGSTVEWVNRDAVVHTATAEDGSWDSRGIQPGERWRATFHQPGVYSYYCGPHPYMKAVVIVR
jgi:plastocyanin